MQGRIIKALAGFYYVEHDGVVYQTRARGNFRKKGKHLMLEILLNFRQRKIQRGISLKSVNESIV